LTVRASRLIAGYEADSPARSVWCRVMVSCVNWWNAHLGIRAIRTTRRWTTVVSESWTGRNGTEEKYRIERRQAADWR